MQAMTHDNHAVRLAFYGRTARHDAADTEAERHWQQHSCRAAVAACGGLVTAWFFDTTCPADMPLANRPQGRALLAALADRPRRIDAVVATDAGRLLPRKPDPDGSVHGWPGAWHTALLLADIGITISSPQEYDLTTGILLGLGRPPRREQAPSAAFTSLTTAGVADRERGTTRRLR